MTKEETSKLRNAAFVIIALLVICTAALIYAANNKWTSISLFIAVISLITLGVYMFFMCILSQSYKRASIRQQIWQQFTLQKIDEVWRLITRYNALYAALLTITIVIIASGSIILSFGWLTMDTLGVSPKVLEIINIDTEEPMLLRLYMGIICLVLIILPIVIVYTSYRFCEWIHGNWQIAKKKVEEERK